jgi:chitin disaccharide deacetylase
MRLLIVNADDFGLNASANAGIIECHCAGSVTSTTLMANAPAFAEAIELASSHPALGVGLHFNLTWGRPLSDPARVPALVDAEGLLLGRERLGRRCLLGQVPTAQIECELGAQFIRLAASGVNPTHVDSHQHVHAFPQVFDAVAQICKEERIPMRVPWVAKAQSASVPRRLRRGLLAVLLQRSTSRWMRRVRWNDALGSVFDLGVAGEALADWHYAQVLQRSDADVFELMVHPVTSAGAMEGYTRVGAVGEAEYRWLREGRLRGLAESQGYRLGSYRELAG